MVETLEDLVAGLGIEVVEGLYAENPHYEVPLVLQVLTQHPAG